jgi:hypothetical protein
LVDISTPLTGTTVGSNVALNLESQASGRDVEIRMGDTVNSSGRFGYLSGSLYWAFGSTEQMRLTSTGLGIGTSSPDSKLVVQGGSGTYAQIKDGTVNIFIQARSVDSAGVIGTLTNHALQFWTNSAVKATIDSSGNLGLGVTPSAWSGYHAIQMGAYANFYNTNSGQTGLATSTYNNGTNWIYNSNNPAFRYEQDLASQSHRWFIAPTGTAGNAITFTQAMTLDASGNLIVGRSTAVTQITFNGGDGITYQRSTDNTFSGVLDYMKSRGSAASPTAVQNGDDLFALRVAPYHGSAYTYLASQVIQVDGTFTSGQNPPTRIAWYTNAANGSSTERARITSVGNFKIGGTADRATTEGTNQLVLFNGTAPVGTLTNGVSFYSESGEARVMDAAGNSTLLSPHDTATNEWIFHSKHTPTGKVLRIDVERLLKFVNDHFGLDAVHEFIEE